MKTSPESTSKTRRIGHSDQFNLTTGRMQLRTTHYRPARQPATHVANFIRSISTVRFAEDLYSHLRHIQVWTLAYENNSFHTKIDSQTITINIKLPSLLRNYSKILFQFVFFVLSKFERRTKYARFPLSFSVILKIPYSNS